MLQNKHQSFVYTQLNDKPVLFQAIQFSISHLFTHSLIVKVVELKLVTVVEGDPRLPFQ